MTSRESRQNDVSSAADFINDRFSNRGRKPSLFFVRAVNFELTYHCNMRCSHCLQAGMRETTRREWIPAGIAKKALEDACAAGFTSSGVNFTGGEIFLPDSNLPDLLETAMSLKLNVRVNTNGWWGDKADIRIGKLRFPSADHVVDWLQDLHVTILALSFDRRYEQYPHLWHSVASIVRECERRKQHYQIVCTGATSDEILEGWRRLTEEEGVHPRYLIPVEMEAVDIGGAALNTEESLEALRCDPTAVSPPCGGKGFFRPYYLHFSPDGGVRTCLYAPGAGWLGNICRESLGQITEKFFENLVVSSFSDNECAFLFKTYVEPYAHIYRWTKHPCAAFAVLACAIAQHDRYDKRYGKKPSEKDLRLIHENIAREFNLYRSPEDPQSNRSVCS